MQQAKNLAKLKNNSKNILIFLHLEDCPWCHFVIDEVLNSMSEMKEYTDNLIIKSVEINAGYSLVDFNKKYISANNFAFNYDVNFYPTILLFDENGMLLEKIIGVANKDFYWNDLDKIFTKYNIL